MGRGRDGSGGYQTGGDEYAREGEYGDGNDRDGGGDWRA